MVARGCGGGEGPCANAAPPTTVTMTEAQVARSRRHSTRTRDRPYPRLIIDHHAPGDAPDRDGDDRLAAPGVDDGDVVAEPVGNVELALIARQRDAPRALADQDVALNLARRHVDRRDVSGVSERDIGGLAVPGHGQADRRDVGLAHARRQELDLAGDGEVRAIDDVDLAR